MKLKGRLRWDDLDYYLFRLYADEIKRLWALAEPPKRQIAIGDERTPEQAAALEKELLYLPNEYESYQSESIKKLNELGKTFQSQSEEESDLCKKLAELNEIAITVELDEDTKNISTLIHSPIKDFIKDNYPSISNLRKKYLNNSKTLRENVYLEDKKEYTTKYNKVEDLICVDNLELSQLKRLLKFFEKGALKYPRLMHVVLEWPLCATMPKPPKELSDYCEQEEYEYMLRRLKVPVLSDSCFSTPETQSTAWLLYPKNESWSKESGFNLFHQLWYDINSEFNCNWEILLHSYGITESYSNNQHLADDGWDGLFDDDYTTFDEDGWKNGFYQCYYITDVFHESIRLCKHLLSICNKNDSKTKGLKQYLSILNTAKELAASEEIKLTYEVTQFLYQWVADQKAKTAKNFIPEFAELLAFTSERMDKIILWLKWNKTSIAEHIEQEYKSLIEWADKGTCEKSNKKEIETAIGVTRGASITLATTLTTIAEFAKQEKDISKLEFKNKSEKTEKEQRSNGIKDQQKEDELFNQIALSENELKTLKELRKHKHSIAHEDLAMAVNLSRVTVGKYCREKFRVAGFSKQTGKGEIILPEGIEYLNQIDKSN